MNIELKRVDKDYNFEAIGNSGIPVNIDGAVEIGGHNNGARPMELILMGLGGCSAIDIISILKKQKQVIANFDISIKAERKKDVVPSIFDKISVIYKLEGDLNRNKVKRAIELSMEKYCSVTAILNKTAKIEYSFTLNGE